jgi:hypothetical protein
VTPTRIIVGNNTQMITPRGLAFDGCGYLHVLDSLDNEAAPTQGSLLAFAPNANGNAAPVMVLRAATPG